MLLMLQAFWIDRGFASAEKGKRKDGLSGRSELSLNVISGCVKVLQENGSA